MRTKALKFLEMPFSVLIFVSLGLMTSTCGGYNVVNSHEYEAVKKLRTGEYELVKKEVASQARSEVALGGLLDQGSVINWGEEPIIGVVNDGAKREYVMNLFKFGIEEYEHEDQIKLQGHNQWELECFSLTTDGKPSCTLKWIDIECVADPNSFHDCVGDIFSSTDGNLMFTNIDWANGDLYFDLIVNPKVHVFMKLKYEGSIIRLGSFRAYQDVYPSPSGNGVLPPKEYKIPTYTYALQTPIRLKGMHSENEKQWDDMISSLSNEDQLTWQKMKLGPRPRISSSDAEASIAAVHEWVSSSGFSQQGKKTIDEFLSDKFAALKSQQKR